MVAMAVQPAGATEGEDFWRRFHGPNAGYVLDLYERFRG